MKGPPRNLRPERLPRRRPRLPRRRTSVTCDASRAMSEKPLPAIPLAAGVADVPLTPMINEPAANSPANAKDLKLNPVMSLPFEIAPRYWKLAPYLWQCFDRNQKGSRYMARELFYKLATKTCKQIRLLRWLP